MIHNYAFTFDCKNVRRWKDQISINNSKLGLYSLSFLKTEEESILKTNMTLFY